MPHRFLTTPYGTFPYQYTEKRVKNLNLRLDKAGILQVSAPIATPFPTVEAFLQKNAALIYRWYQNRLQVKSKPNLLPSEADLYEGATVGFRGRHYRLHLQEGKCSLAFSRERAVLTLPHPSDPKKRLTAWEQSLKACLLPILTQIVHQRLPFFLAQGAQAPTEIRIRKMVGAWGNCRPKSGVLTFSLLLAPAAPELWDAVVCHELCHLLYPNHSARFYQLLSQVCPDHKKYSSRLKNRDILANPE